MRILVPHVSLHPDARDALGQYAPGALRWKLGPHRTAYHWAWADHWDTCRRMGQALMIVEQDIVIHEGVVPGFLSCPESWCVYPYPGPGGRPLTRSLGCVRWSHGLLLDQPDLPEAVGRIDDGDGIGPRDWRRLDVRIAMELERRGYTAHQHTPPVAHRHHYEPENQPCLCGTCPTMDGD